MTKNCTVIIPARKGSKGIKNKNMAYLGGKRLIEWSIDLAQKLEFITNIVVSTDCPEIAKLVKSKGIRFNDYRDSKLAKDETSMSEVILYEIKKRKIKGDFILLQPTSPFRNLELVREAYKEFQSRKPKSLVSIVQKSKGVFWTFTRDENSGFIDSLFNEIPTRRQDMPECYELNGSIYISSAETFLKSKSFFSPETFGFIMEEKFSIDIDTYEDLELARNYLENLEGAEKQEI